MLTQNDIISQRGVVRSAKKKNLRINLDEQEAWQKNQNISKERKMLDLKVKTDANDKQILNLNRSKEFEKMEMRLSTTTFNEKLLNLPSNDTIVERDYSKEIKNLHGQRLKYLKNSSDLIATSLLKSIECEVIDSFHNITQFEQIEAAVSADVASYETVARQNRIDRDLLNL